MVSRRPRAGLLVLLCCTGLIAWLVPAGAGADSPNPAIVQLTNSEAVDVRPAWSPDNRSIAFQSNRDSSTFHIYVMNADGSAQRALTQGAADDRHPAWMPDGKTILFDSSDGTRGEIWSVSLADGNRRQITRLGASASFPSPSPDGQRLAFYLFQNETLDLWTVRLDGSDARPLTHGLANAQNNQCTFPCHQAAWSPDNQLLAYSAGELDSIWAISADGSNARPVVADGADNHFPWFMADGRLGYITEHINPGQAWTDAWAYDLRQGKTSLLQERISLQGPFEWSADNRKVLFHSPRSGNFDIYVIDLAAPEGMAALQGQSLAAQATGASTRAAATRAPQDTREQPAGSDTTAFVALLGVLVTAVVGAGVLVGWKIVSSH